MLLSVFKKGREKKKSEKHWVHDHHSSLPHEAVLFLVEQTEVLQSIVSTLPTPPRVALLTQATFSHYVWEGERRRAQILI